VSIRVIKDVERDIHNPILGDIPEFTAGHRSRAF
jgi:hypothetical protein